MRPIFLGIILFIFSLTTGNASDAQTIGRLEAAWSNWTNEVGARRSALVVTRNGKIVHRVGKGMKPEATVELASLGKAVTAACIDTLVSQKRISYDTKISAILGDVFSDPVVGKVTVGDLVSHSSGIAPDSTQHSMGSWFGSNRPRHNDVFETVARRKTQEGKRGRYYYNNENYALLGAIVEKMTGMPYAKACGRPAGVSGFRVSSKTGGFAPWGGWSGSLEQYAVMHSELFGKERPSRKARTSLGGGANYGLGTLWRKSGSAHNYWHFGLLCFPGRMNAGSLAVSWQGKWGVYAYYDVCTSEAQMGALDSALVGAVFR